MNAFEVSVIIPVYNAERFIEKAISSALEQSEVFEVIIINDGSTDATEEILTQILEQNSKVRVLYHDNKCNKGRSASRNLGIKKARGNYIAFLDADDYYLPNRFNNDKLIFENEEEVDGVYNAIGAHFYRSTSAKERKRLELCTMTEKVSPENLFMVLLKGGKGHFSIDGLTVKKMIFEKTGLFNEDLIVAEDTELIWKMTLKAKLYSGIIDYSVAIRGVHDNNVFYNDYLYKIYDMKMYESLLCWSSKNEVDLKYIDALLNRIWIIKFKQKKILINDIGYWWFLFFRSPRLMFSFLSVKYFPIVRQRQKLFPFLFK
ncbi:glycosyltransferase family 2 protein [Tamlana agarivorans]|uniref:Glycosyltransferase family 2 protein n=1 Tax=Pseudotamlana agarivorans TaxID=481183 RepID=A0ACC5UD00_9FLAO|nr:glycosyltransferase family A protein [Tamlana agarivorans]MBU2952156.1 glycosyltransferase family 2 protein [Tamlana agarivorans]